MEMVLTSFFLPLIVCASIAFGVTPIVIKYAAKLKIIDDPKNHKHPKVVHSTPVPRGGGLVIMSALLSGGLLFLPKDTWLYGILAGAAILAGIGFLDDRFEEQVSPRLRLFLNALAALCVIGVGIGITFVTNPFGGVIRLDTFRYCFEFGGGPHCINILASLFALVWLVGLQNIVGWSSGVDGQLPGFVVVAAITMATLTTRFLGTGDYSAIFSLTLSGIVAGAYLGFLPWNWWPQKIIPGYGGKSLAGFLLGVLAIISSAKVGALMLVLGVPIVDAAMVIFKRLREKRSPLAGG
ncbi:MAG: MraY family glycosyltransferase, partial [Patescibacteria group bacterium]